MRLLALAAAVLLIAAASGFGVHALAAGGSAPRSVTSNYDYVWQAAAKLSGGCPRRDNAGSDVDGFLWLRAGSEPLAYLIEDQLVTPDVVSTRGDHFALWGEFWPCRTPVAIYMRPPSPNTVMTVLTPKQSARKTITLGRFRLAEGVTKDSPAGYGNAIVAANGRIIFFSGQTIRYAGGKEFTAPGLPHGWQISSLAVSPHDPSVFLANANTSTQVSCRSSEEHGAVFLITPTASTRLKSYDACQGQIDVAWSPDGRKILWFVGGDKTHLDISDGLGRHLRELTGHAVCGALWSPDGREIAYGYTCERAAVLDLATGRSRIVARGQLEAWSPDGKELAVMRVHRPWYGPGTPAAKLVAVPLDGGSTRVLIRIPRTK